MRLQHIFEKDEDKVLSRPVVVDLDELFGDSGFFISTFEERSLTTVWKASEMKRYHWNTDDKEIENSYQSWKKHTVTLNPMDIKTFFVQFMQQ